MGKTPYEAWKGKKPHLQHVKGFGCITHMKVPGFQTKKLDDHRKVVVYLGSETRTKAHHLFDPKDGAILVSRDVIFEEDKSWWWELSSRRGINNSDAYTMGGTTVNVFVITDSTMNSGGDSTPVRSTSVLDSGKINTCSYNICTSQ